MNVITALRPGMTGRERQGCENCTGNSTLAEQISRRHVHESASFMASIIWRSAAVKHIAVQASISR
jgi:hypothetical protein